MAMYYVLVLLLCLPAYAYEIPTHWESTQYIWNFNLIAKADKGIVRNPRDYFAQDPIFDLAAYADIHAGDLVWVKCRFIPQFCNTVLPHLREPIILLIADGDESFPSECGDINAAEQLINNPYIVHIFAQNNDYQKLSNKVSSIPIGMDFHTVAYKNVNGGWGQIGTPSEQEEQLNALLCSLKPTHQRKKKAFVDFHHANTMRGDMRRYQQCGEDRQSIFEKLSGTGLIDYGPWMSRFDLWSTKGQYAFSISPHGNGLDCHRTWEDLILGCIVIVKSSVLDQLYEGLPVVIVKDWSEITEKNMDEWLARYADAFSNPSYREKLTNHYWDTPIKARAQSLKKSPGI